MSNLASEIVEASGLSQSEVARRAGMKATLVNAYVRGRKSPSAVNIARLADAAGVRVSVSRRAPRPGPLVREHRSELVEATRRAGYDNLYVFGSVARGEDVEGSDADFLVEGGVPSGSLLDSPLARLRTELAGILGVSVDLDTLDERTPAFVRREMAYL